MCPMNGYRSERLKCTQVASLYGSFWMVFHRWWATLFWSIEGIVKNIVII